MERIEANSKEEVISVVSSSYTLHPRNKDICYSYLLISFDSIDLGNNILALLDSGAKGNYICSDLIKQLNFSFIPGPVIQLANGSKIATDKLKDPLTLTYNNSPFPLEFTLIDYLVYPIILGMDFFHYFKPQFNFSHGFISINQAPFKLQLVKNPQYCMEKTSNLSSIFPLVLIPDLNEKKFESKLNFKSDFELVPSPQKIIFHSTT